MGLQTPVAEEEFGAVLERCRHQLKEGKQEVVRRRNLLTGPVMLVRLPRLQLPNIRVPERQGVLGGERPRKNSNLRK
jgi:hypothetical protein